MTEMALLNKSNFLRQSGSDHHIPDLVVVSRGKAEVQNHQLDSLQQGAYKPWVSHILGG
jgi:hypothetical protein